MVCPMSPNISGVADVQAGPLPRLVHRPGQSRPLPQRLLRPLGVPGAAAAGRRHGEPHGEPRRRKIFICKNKNICSGTDNGFTFTSPNWPTVPRGVVFPISSQYPAHPAGSFHYPHLATLPSIATIHLTKVTSSLVHRTFHGYCF